MREFRSGILVVILGLLCFHISAINVDDYSFSAKVQKVSSNGYYRIALTPNIISQINAQYSDIRIVDSKGEEIPYVLKSEVKLSEKELFVTYPIIAATSDPGKMTSLIIHNKKKKSISSIQLLIKNADVNKEATLLGSDDQKKWYVVKNRFNLYSLYHDKNTSSLEAMNFPPSDYEFLKFEINDSSTAPIKVIKAGYFDHFSEKGKYQIVPVFETYQVDSSDGKSYIRISFNGNQELDQVNFEFSGAKLYHREARLTWLKEKKVKKRKTETYFETFHNFHVSSNHQNTLRFDALRVNTFYLIINNADDQPIKLQNITCSQLLTYINVKLEKDDEYTIMFGNHLAEKPRYDLRYFADSIPNEAAVLSIGEIQKREETEKEGKKEGPSLIWIWIIMGVVLALLLFMTRKMIKEMREKNSA